MARSLHSQLEGLYHRYAKGIGISRHNLKKNGVVDTKIHSDNSRAAYVGVWHRIARYAEKNHGVTRVEQLSQEIIASWLKEQVKRQLAPDTLGQYCAALKKLQHTLNMLETEREEHALRLR